MTAPPPSAPTIDEQIEAVESAANATGWTWRLAVAELRAAAATLRLVRDGKLVPKEEHEQA